MPTANVTAVVLPSSYSGTLTALRSHPDVELVEENHIKTIATFNEEDEDDACSFQNNAIWVSYSMVVVDKCVRGNADMRISFFRSLISNKQTNRTSRG